MSALDLTLLAIVGVSALFGVMRGFISALASMVAWLLSGWVAFHYGGEAAQWLSSDGPPSASELLGGYALSFIGVMVVVGLTGWAIRHLVKSVGLSGLDRALGFALGLARGAFVACIVLLLTAFSDRSTKTCMRGWCAGWGRRTVPGRGCGARRRFPAAATKPPASPTG